MILWGLVALRLVLPLSVSSTLSLLQLGNAADLPAQLEDALNSDDTYRGNYKTAIEGSREYELAVLAGSPVAANTEGGKMAYYYERANGSIAPAKTSYEMFLIIGSHVWLAGMAALWLWAICSYLRLKYRLRFSIRLCKGVYETDAVPSPCVTGILRPQIYLIPALTDQQKEHILLHEKMHIRHLDPVWKMVSFVVISIHWFNPFLWFMYKIFQGELEKACDERVLAHLGEDKKADYSESLLALSASKNWRQKWNFPTPVSFGENNIKGRIKRILAYQKPLAAVSVLTALLAAVGCVIFLTTPADSATDPSSTNPGTQTALNPPPDDTIPLSTNTEPPLTDQPATQSTAAPTEITTALNESIEKITSLKSAVLPAIPACVKFPPTASSQALSAKRSHRATGSQRAGRSVKADCWKKFHRTYTISGTGIGCNYMRNCPFTLLSDPTTHIPYNRKMSASYRPLPTGTGCF